PKPNHCVLAQFVFHIFSLSQRRAGARAGARIRVYFAMQTFFGSVKIPSSSRLRRDRLRASQDWLFGYTNVFSLREKVQRLRAAFAADAALFHSAERNAEVADEPAIDPYRAGINSFGHAMRAVQVLCPDAGGKT